MCLAWASCRICGTSNGVDNEVDDGESENRDDEADNGVKDSVFSVSNFFAVTSRNDVTETTINEHNNGDDADGVEDSIGNLSEDSFLSNELGWHTIAASGFSTFLDGESHYFAGCEGESGSYACKNLNRSFDDFVHLFLAVICFYYSTMGEIKKTSFRRSSVDKYDYCPNTALSTKLTIA